MGIKEIEIKNIDQFNAIIWEQKYLDSIKRNRSNYFIEKYGLSEVHMLK